MSTYPQQKSAVPRGSHEATEKRNEFTSDKPKRNRWEKAGIILARLILSSIALPERRDL